jgi:murein L,D-transpeptidase YafK
VLLLALTLAASVAVAALPGPIRDPRIVVDKSERTLTLRSGETVVRSWRVGLGLEPVAPKAREGDNATPEGAYFVCVKNPRSRFRLSLGLSYPGPADAERGLRDGLITSEQRDRIVASHERRRTPPWDTPLGGEIFIHGNGSGSDWTWGCIALDDADVEELYRVIPVGTPVEIRP